MGGHVHPQRSTQGRTTDRNVCQEDIRCEQPWFGSPPFAFVQADLTWCQAWLPSAVLGGTVPDAIVDANHMIHYLKYAATRCLFTKQGKEKETDERLSAVRRRLCPFV